MLKMFPKTLALIDDDRDYGSYLAQHLRSKGIAVRVFESGAVFLASQDAYGFDFYVVDLMLPGVDGLSIIKVLRVRTQAGVVVVSGKSSPDVFASIVKAGADMYLAKPVSFDQVLLAIEAVHRRSGHTLSHEGVWQLDMQLRELLSPDGTRITLSETDFAIMQSLLHADGDPVSRESLRQSLGYPDDDSTDSTLNAAIFRLRRRIEKATGVAAPLQAKSKLGYLFKARLTAA
jgi:two-component system, OmpR family, response regulator